MNEKKLILAILFIFSCMMIARPDSGEKRRVVTPNFRLELPENMTMHRSDYYPDYFFLKDWENVSLNYDFYTEENKADSFLSFCVVKDLIANNEEEAIAIAATMDRLMEGFEKDVTVRSEFYSPHTFSEKLPYPVLEVHIGGDDWLSPSWFIFTPEGTGFLILHDGNRPEMKGRYKGAVTEMISSLRMNRDESYAEMFKRSSNALPFKTPTRLGDVYIGARTPESDDEMVKYKEFTDQYDPDMAVSFVTDMGYVSISPIGCHMMLSEPELLRTMIEGARTRYEKEIKPADARLDFRDCFDLLENDYFPDPRIQVDRNGQRLMFSLDLYSSLEDEDEDEEHEAGFIPRPSDRQQEEGMFFWQRLVVTPHNIYQVTGIYFSLPGQGKTMRQFKADFEEVLNTIEDAPFKQNEWWVSLLQAPSEPSQKEYNGTDYPLLSYPLSSDHYTFDRISTTGRWYHHFFYHKKEKLYIVETENNYTRRTWYDHINKDIDISCKAYDENGNFVKEISSLYEYNLADLIEYVEGEWVDFEEPARRGSGRFTENDLLKAIRRHDLYIQHPSLLFYSSPRGNSRRPSGWMGQLFTEISLEKETVRFSNHTFNESVFEPMDGYVSKISRPARYTHKKGPIFLYLPPAENRSGGFEEGGLFIVREK